MERIHPAQVGQEIARGNKPVIQGEKWYILQGSRIITSDMVPKRQPEEQQLLKDVKHVFDGAEQRKEIGKAQAQDRDAIIPQEFNVFVANRFEGVK